MAGGYYSNPTDLLSQEILHYLESVYPLWELSLTLAIVIGYSVRSLPYKVFLTHAICKYIGYTVLSIRLCHGLDS
jgi:hypothetical protein